MADSQGSKSGRDLLGAIIRGELDGIDACVRERVDLSQPIIGESPPLHYAIEQGSTAAVRRLIAGGADVNGREGQWQKTPLMLASKRGKREVVELLLGARADVTLADANEWAALDAAASCDAGPAGSIVAALIAAGADVERLSRTWGTPLIKASWTGHTSAVAALLSAGADVNRATPSGTPLLQAVQNKRPEVVAVLLAAGADPSHRYVWPETLRFNDMFIGMTPVELARAKRLRRVLEVLEGAPPAVRPSSAVTDVPALWAQLPKPGLAGPATEEQIAELAATVGQALPADLVASLRLHNGQSRGSLDGHFGLLSTVESANEWSMWKGLHDSGEFRGRDGTPDDGVRSDWWHPGWLPVLSDGGGNSICVDLSPAPGGIVGQVIRMDHESPARPRLAASFAAYLADLVARRSAK